MILYHCSYIHRTGKICGRRSKSKRCYIHRNSPIPTPCRDCGEPNRSKYNACNKHVGKYKSKENYDRKKQDELCAQITMFKNYISDFPDSSEDIFPDLSSELLILIELSFSLIGKCNSCIKPCSTIWFLSVSLSCSNSDTSVCNGGDSVKIT